MITSRFLLQWSQMCWMSGSLRELWLLTVHSRKCASKANLTSGTQRARFIIVVILQQRHWVRGIRQCWKSSSQNSQIGWNDLSSTLSFQMSLFVSNARSSSLQTTRPIRGSDSRHIPHGRPSRRLSPRREFLDKNTTESGKWERLCLQDLTNYQEEIPFFSSSAIMELGLTSVL